MWTDDGHPGFAPGDLDLATAVATRLIAHEDGVRWRVHVHRGVVTLCGSRTDAGACRTAAAVAATVPGVVDVEVVPHDRCPHHRDHRAPAAV